MISPGTSSVDCGWTCIKHCAVNSQWKHFPVVLMATNPFFNKFFPRVFYSLTFGPAGWHFSFLILQPEENRRCSLQRCDAVFGVSLSRVSAAVWLRWSRVRAEDECVCECVLRGGGRIHMNERTKFHINQQQITANRRIKAMSAFKRWLHALRSLKNGFRLVKAATSTQRQRDCSSGGSEALGFFLSLSRCWCK